MAPEFPSVGHDVTGTDWGVIYGPLGLMAGVFLVGMILVWRWASSEISKSRTECDARVEAARSNAETRVEAARSNAEARVAAARADADEEREAAIKLMRERDQEWREEIRAIAVEMGATTRSVTDKYHEHAIALRTVIETSRGR